MFSLALAFLATAALYASVGFGGGSTYNALLVLAGTDYRLVPVVGLACNLIVVAGGTLVYVRSGWLRLDVALPLAIASVPCAWLGGATPVDQATFSLLLGGSLVVAGGLLLVPNRAVDGADEMRISRRRLWLFGPVIGAAIGYLAGLVGIGGGIFLSPVLHLGRLAHPKVIAATASVFILVNSIAGLGGQWFKLQAAADLPDAGVYAWLLLAVFVGGQIGSRAGVRRLNGTAVRALTGVLVIYVGLRLLYTWWTIGARV
jgi:uncharacterized membrane protein YfcA